MTQGKPWDTVTLKLWHGGCFREGDKCMVYMGSTFRTVGVDPDEMCWFTLVEEAEKCGFNRDSDGIFFMSPGVGLKRALDDTHAAVLCKMAVEERVVECFIIPGSDLPHLMDLIECGSCLNLMKMPCKMIPRRKGSTIKGPPLSSPTSALSTTKGQSSGQPSNKKGSKTSQSNKKKSINTSETVCKTAAKASQKPQKAVCKTPTKASQKPETPKRTSPRFISKQPTPPDTIQLKTTTLSQTIPQSTSTQIHLDFHEPSYDCNELRVADLFNEYEENADLAALFGDDLSEDEISDPGYNPEFESEGDETESDVELVDEDDLVNEALDEGDLGELSDADEELAEARVRLKQFNADALKIVTQLQLEAASGKLSGQEKATEGNLSCAIQTDNQLSDYDESGDEERTPENSDEESIPGKRITSKIPVVNERSDFNKLKWCVGISFPNTEAFRDCLTRYAIAQGRDLTFDVSDKAHGRKLGVRCKSGCPFRVYGSWDNQSAAFVVKAVDPGHTCQRTMESNRQLKSTWLAKQFLDVFKAKPHWPAADIIETVRRAYKVLIKKGFAYKVKYYAHRLLHGSMKEHYSRLGSYIAALEDTNPTSYYTLFTNPNVTSNPPVFQRFYVCFDALKQGWLLGCRRIISVDACFLKTFLGGQLIAAVGRDGNEQMFPLAWAVVEGENNESYEWFFKQLKTSLGIEDGEGMTIISDQHLSIMAMVAQEFPRAEHRHCARHIFANWHKTYKGEDMKLLFWACAKSYNEPDFNEALENLKEADPKAADAFVACNPTLFCRAFIQKHTCNDVIVSNMSETFNAYIISARSKHLIYMLEEIRTQIMQRLVEKKVEMEGSTHVVCPNVQKLLEIQKDKASSCKAVPSTATLFQVQDGIDSLTVDLEARTCTCKKWDLTGIPCFHAISAIFSIYEHAEDYVSDYYKRPAYLRTYSLGINPVPGQRHWPKRDKPLNPPPIKVGPGRPRKKRRRDPHEDPIKKGKLSKHGLVMTCSICKSQAHNKRKCPDKDKALPQPSAPKNPMGRPRKYARVEPTVEGTGQTSQTHHAATAQPTRVGRNGRIILSGRGGGRGSGRGVGRSGGRADGRGGGRGRSRGGGRFGGRTRAPQGFGVLFDDLGNAFTNAMGGTSGPSSIAHGEAAPNTQDSVNHM